MDKDKKASQAKPDSVTPGGNTENSTKPATLEADAPCTLKPNQPPSKPEWEGGNGKNKTFLDRLKKDVRKPTVILEVIALLGLLIYTCETHRANTLTKTSLNIGQRAYLAYGALEDVGVGIKIHLSNFGHLPARVNGGKLRYQRNVWPANISKTDVLGDVKPLVVSPGPTSDSIIMVLLSPVPDPEKPLVEAGREIIAISGTLEYDDGFGETDTLLIAINYDWEKKIWVHTGAGTDVQFKAPTKIEK